MGVGALSTGGAVSGSTGRVMNASGVSARVLQYSRLRFVATIKTHDDILFAANRVSPPDLVQFSVMFPSSSKENVPPMTPRPYHPGCSMTFDQWQKSESNRIRALTIKKGRESLGGFQDPAGPFGLSKKGRESLGRFQDPARPFGLFGSSSYAASMTSATIEYEVKRQVELEINRRVEQELQRVPSVAAAKSFPSMELLESDEDDPSEDDVFEHQPTSTSAFNDLSQLKQPSSKVRNHFPFF